MEGCKKTCHHFERSRFCASENQKHVAQCNNILVGFSMNTVSACRLSVTLSCPLDLTLFPMDTQRCKMQLESCECYKEYGTADYHSDGESVCNFAILKFK